MDYRRAIYYTSPVITGDDVTYVQERLKGLGFYKGAIDGSFGPSCKQAVISFQKTNLLEPDGSVGPITWNFLFSSNAINVLTYTRALYYTSPVITGNDVSYVQRRLKLLGFYTEEVDGSFGPACKQAVMDFQNANGLAVDGSVGPATWNKLFGIDSSGGIGNLGSIKKVFIDPGHGGIDPGALGNGLREKDITLSMALKLGNLLQSKGMSVQYSRTTDKYVSLQNRASQANAWGADLFVSIHCNAFTSSSAHGTECFTYPSASASTKALSRNVSNDMAKSLSLTNRGHKEANFAVLRLTKMPAILTETAFITNSSDASKLSSRQNEFVSSLASQILGANIDLPDETKGVLYYARQNGLFKGLGINIETFNTKSPVQLISIKPLVTLQVELSATSKFPIPTRYEVLDLSLSPGQIETSLLGKLGSAGVIFGSEMNLQMPINQLKATQNIDKYMKYSVQPGNGYLEVTFEVAAPTNDRTTYQRFIYKIHRDQLDFSGSTVQIPVQSTNREGINLEEFDIIPVALTAVAVIAVIGFIVSTGGLGAAAPAILIPLFIKW
ncbi:N-acetylmuramoyl-L-alanine amidase [Alkalibaculum bacchi]|uniref:N-acetylmuramoyl-L-alanine amidase n=1 Tax=Alkalibaculum bacchi TaxID=645887 RepID=A0A366HYK6_9FIRM|nr:N-acetylmuramoyl-L-alanine amidase [Alkalibaculum bacchi]RBP58749.1 N-acetylmuramoyl-L-alanine amidase [Alkalibaculum bacchi]